MANEEYLGDGCFVSFDGWQFCLRAPRDGGDHVVYLDGIVLWKFQEYVQRMKENQNEAAYDRQQERLMESGPGPTLLEQQQAAMKLK